MKLPLIIGALILVLVLAAFIVAPQLRSGAIKAAEKARDQATLAERAIYQYDYSLPDVKRLAPPDELKPDDRRAAIADKVKPNLEQDKKDVSKRLNEIRSQAQKAGLKEPQVDVPTADASGLKRALTHYEQMLADNEQLLKQAAQDARAAKQSASGVLGTCQVTGMVDYTRAARAFADAGVLRDQHQQLQAELRRINSQTKTYEASQACAAGMEMAAVASGLRRDLADVQKIAADAATSAEKLAAQVTQREQELAPVNAEQDQVRDELLALENTGFKVGDDASFEKYRAEYMRLSTRARQLQEQEELLRLGGLRGAQFASEDYENSEIQGGEAVVSLEVLRQTAAAAQEAATRASKSVTALQQQIQAAEKSGQDAQGAVGRYAGEVQQLRTRQAELLGQIIGLAKKASDKEDEALKAAADAAGAFHSSQQAADGWVREARDLQSQSDPQHSNPRLKMILDDKAMPAMGSSAEAEALVLTGRIYAQRLEADRSLLADLKQLRGGQPKDEGTGADESAERGDKTGGEQATPDDGDAATGTPKTASATDTPKSGSATGAPKAGSPGAALQADADQDLIDKEISALEDQIKGIDKNAQPVLQSAIKIYEGLVNKAKPETKWVWVPQAALAGVYAVLARISPSEAVAHLSNARDWIQKSTGGRERSPYVSPYVDFQQHLEKLLAGDKESAAEKPAEAEEAGGS